MDELAATAEFRDSHLLPAVRGELLIRLGRVPEAREALGLVVERCGTPVSGNCWDASATRSVDGP